MNQLTVLHLFIAQGSCFYAFMITTHLCVSLWISLGCKARPNSSSVINFSLVMLTVLRFIAVVLTMI